jgi:arginyl-tRNA synthetase
MLALDCRPIQIQRFFPLKHQIEQLIATALTALPAGTLPSGIANTEIEIERTRDAAHGDFATNLALKLAKPAKKNPRQLAQALVDALPKNEWIAKVEIAGPGFINFHLSAAAYAHELLQVIKQGANYGTNDNAKGETALVEFVSANPTGPLHVGHGRQAALGDALSALLQTQGFKVSREFYYNDAGVQINNLALSVQARAKGLKPGDANWPEGSYQGEYIQDIANDFIARKTVHSLDGEPFTANGDITDLENIRHFAVTYLRHEQDVDLQKFGVKFDRYYLESSLYTEGKVDAAVQAFKDSGKAYESEGALWLKTTDFGDDKDRVVRKSDGTYTYFVPDVAYHITKWQRGFHHAINIQGSDHHGTVARVRAGLQTVNSAIAKDYPQYVLHKMVKVMRGGEEVKISKRAGEYVTLRDLTEWVGKDAVRFFLVLRRADSEFVFDIDLALAKSEDNPVYYVQYANARVCRVQEQLKERSLAYALSSAADLTLLTEPHEIALVRRIAQYPELLTTAALALEPHQVANYLRDLAGEFHSYYNALKFIVDDATLRNARITLALVAQQVIRNGLTLLGVSAPDKM